MNIARNLRISFAAFAVYVLFALSLTGLAIAQAPAEPAAPAELAEDAAAAEQPAPTGEQAAPAPDAPAEPAAAAAPEAGEPKAEESDAPVADAAPAPGQESAGTAEGEGTKEEAGKDEKKKKKKKDERSGFEKFMPILILLIVVAIVIGRLPKIKDIGHTDAFRKRRVLNWLPLGLTYSFLYMGRYNLKISKFAFEKMVDSSGEALMGNNAFGIIFGVGTVVYGVSFLINGPLTDKYGGRFSILVGAGGATVMNALMGVGALTLLHEGPGHTFVGDNFVPLYSVLYAANMYFQSFGAVAIVKVNAPWFHVRERGVFGAIFGILISLGIYFAYDWGYMILNEFGLEWVFFVPAIVLTVLWSCDVFVVKNTPGDAGHKDFDTADASSGDEGPQLKAVEVFKLMMRNPIIITIALVEFCSGFLRQAIMQWYRTFAKQTDGALGLVDSFVYENWGMLLCAAGILGGVVAGVISDHVFQSRRGPVAAVLYGGLLLGAILLTFTYQTPIVGALVILMSMAVIGVHGMLSGTASMDFGGKKNVGIAVGIIDGFVYLGTAVMAFTYALALPEEEYNTARELVGPATEPDNWIAWPVAMIPVALIGLLLATRVWNAKPKPKTIPAEVKSED